MFFVCLLPCFPLLEKRQGSNVNKRSESTTKFGGSSGPSGWVRATKYMCLFGWFARFSVDLGPWVQFMGPHPSIGPGALHQWKLKQKMNYLVEDISLEVVRTALNEKLRTLMGSSILQIVRKQIVLDTKNHLLE